MNMRDEDQGIEGKREIVGGNIKNEEGYEIEEKIIKRKGIYVELLGDGD